MGRQLTGTRMEHKASPVKMKFNGSSDKGVSSSTSAVDTELKDHQANQGPAPAGNVENEKCACVTSTAAAQLSSGGCCPNGSISPASQNKSLSNSAVVSKKFLDDDDDWSLASSTAASARTTRSRTTVAVAPTFRSAVRLERRKEFYAKLEEKHRALEAVKCEYEARTKEEEAAAIKQLRKSMVVRANPVPSFYYEAPPPNKELKKLPTTRAKSPNISRRKSCGDAVGSSPEVKEVCSRALRRSLGTYNKGGSSPKRKDRIHTSKPTANGTSKVNEDVDRAMEAVKSVARSID